MEKFIMNKAPFHKGYVVLQQLMHNFSNRILLAYFCLEMLLFPLYQFQISPDDISYINIAHLYAIGDFRGAVNGFWAPLISWLLVPFLLVKFQPLFAYKIASLIISLFTFIAIIKLSYRFVLNEKVRLLISLSTIPILLSFTFASTASADLFFLCVVLCYLYYIFVADYNKKPTDGFVIGFLGALLYFSKSYGFYFFIAHFSLFNFIYYLKGKTRQERRNVLLKYTFGLIIFLVLSGIWIYSISNEYHRFTISSSGTYNMKFDSFGSRGQPVLYQGLLPLPYPTAVSAWDDPSYLTIDYEKSPSLGAWITYQIAHTGENMFRTLYYFELFSLFSAIILLHYSIRYFSQHFRKAKTNIQQTRSRLWSRLFQYTQSQNDEKLQLVFFYSLTTMLIYTAGYELLHIEARFLWLDAILLLLLCAYYVHTPPLAFFRNAKLRQFLFLFVFLSFWLYPVALLVMHENEDTDIYMTSQQLQTTYHVKGNIASNDDGDSTNSWGLTLSYAYFLDSKYYGATKQKITDEELQRELRKNHINYYFVWNSTCQLSECKKIAEFEPQFLWTDAKKHLIVYQIKNNGPAVVLKEQNYT